MKLQTMFEVLASMSIAQLQGVRLRLTMSADPAAPVAIKAVESELLRRDVSLYARERYLKTKIVSIPARATTAP